MRVAVRLSAAVALLAVAGCAHVEAPRGGPEMRDPLILAAVTPDSLAVVPGHRGPVVLEFERRLSERGLNDAVMVSPRTSSVTVGHRGRELRVGLREGWEPGRIYQITVTPTIQDLWNNRLTETVTHVFSTGPAIPDTRLVGDAFDRITGRPEVDIRVEAIRAPDSLVYATRTDSAGAFMFAHIPEGDYQVRAFRDTNRNRELDPFEPRDTALARLTTADTASVVLSVVMPDTTPPRIGNARLAQGVIEVQFDDHLDPEQELSPAMVRVTGPDGTEVAVEELTVGQPAGAPGAAPPGQAPGVGGRGIGEGTAGTAPPRGPLPSQTLTIRPAGPLLPETEYTVVVQGVVNVVGLAGGGETTFTTAAAPAEADAEDDPDAEPGEPPAQPEPPEQAPPPGR